MNMTRKITLILSIMLVLSFASCTSTQKKEVDKTNNDSSTKIKVTSTPNMVSIVEVPTADLKRAIKFYQSILAIGIEEVIMEDLKMGVLPSEEGTVSVVLVNGADYQPTNKGCMIYLNGGNNLQTILDKVEPNGGKVIVPKTEISPEMGFFALFTDTEGNQMGLHSPK
jgi:uncharacterized protein